MSSIEHGHDPDAAVIKVTAYRHGQPVRVRLCESADEAAALIATLEETPGVECEAEDLSATEHDPSASDPGGSRLDSGYPHTAESP